MSVYTISPVDLNNLDIPITINIYCYLDNNIPIATLFRTFASFTVYDVHILQNGTLYLSQLFEHWNLHQIMNFRDTSNMNTSNIDMHIMHSF